MDTTCGGRGTDATTQALSVKNMGEIKLVAMADIFEDRVKSSHDLLSKQFPSQMDVPKDRRLIASMAPKRVSITPSIIGRCSRL